MYTVDVVIPTYKPTSEVTELLKLLSEQTYKINKIFILNTEEKYFENIDISSYNNIVVKHIKKGEFDHGNTRHIGACMSEADIIMFMTQDALPSNEYLVENLVKFFNDDDVGAAYARQLPKDDCKETEKFTRSFNYPDKDSVKSIDDLDKLGIKTFFCSNVCAAYKKSVYDSLGGFIRRAIFNEDMIYAGKMIKSGKKIAYASNALVIHSHNYSNIEQLRRNFDLAVSQNDNPDVFSGIKSESEGIRLVKMTMKHCIDIKKPLLIIDVIIKSGFKFLGYKLGRNYEKLPNGLINALTMNKEYWKQ